MHFLNRQITAILLAILLAVLACFGHALHDGCQGCQNILCQSGCFSRLDQCCGERSVCSAHGCCSHDEPVSAEAEFSEQDHPTPTPHDSENCAICRFLALTQLFELPSPLFLSDTLVVGLIEPAQRSTVSRADTLMPIRGPPIC